MLAESLASIDCIDSIDSVESLEPIESIESIESVESVESVESIISIEPIESVESIESCRDCKVYIRATQKTANIHTTQKGALAALAPTTVPMGAAPSAPPPSIVLLFPLCVVRMLALFCVCFPSSVSVCVCVLS